MASSDGLVGRYFKLLVTVFVVVLAVLFIFMLFGYPTGSQNLLTLAFVAGIALILFAWLFMSNSEASKSGARR